MKVFPGSKMVEEVDEEEAVDGGKICSHICNCVLSICIYILCSIVITKICICVLCFVCICICLSICTCICICICICQVAKSDVAADSVWGSPRQ